MYFHPESGKWWTGSPRQCPLSPPSVFLLLHLSFRYRSTLSLSFALSIPKSLFSLDCLSLINLMLNLETYFSKSKGLERKRSADKKMASLIHVYHLLFISLMNRKSSQKYPSAFCLSAAAVTFSCSPIKCHWPYSRLKSAAFKLTVWTADIVQLRGAMLYKIKACWDSNGISLPLKLQLQNVLSLSAAFITFPLFPGILC